MFDHVGIATSDRDASERFYRTVLSTLGAEPKFVDDELIEWEDLDVGRVDDTHVLTQGLHIGLRAPDHATVDTFWQAGVDAGFRSDGEPGPRAVYGPSYYGGFLLDPDGNSVEAVVYDRERSVPDGGIDHLWIGVTDLSASRQFYETIAPYAGLTLGPVEDDLVRMRGDDFSFSLVADGRPPTAGVHIAFSAFDDQTVRDFHAAALAAGYTDNGAPGERPQYHEGYYGAFVLDPDGLNVEVVNHNRG